MSEFIIFCNKSLTDNNNFWSVFSLNVGLVNDLNNYINIYHLCLSSYCEINKIIILLITMSHIFINILNLYRKEPQKNQNFYVNALVLGAVLHFGH